MRKLETKRDVSLLELTGASRSCKHHPAIKHHSTVSFLKRHKTQLGKRRGCETREKRMVEVKEEGTAECLFQGSGTMKRPSALHTMLSQAGRVWEGLRCPRTCTGTVKVNNLMSLEEHLDKTVEQRELAAALTHHTHTRLLWVLPLLGTQAGTT